MSTFLLGAAAGPLHAQGLRRLWARTHCWPEAEEVLAARLEGRVEEAVGGFRLPGRARPHSWRPGSPSPCRRPNPPAAEPPSAAGGRNLEAQSYRGPSRLLRRGPAGQASFPTPSSTLYRGGS